MNVKNLINSHFSTCRLLAEAYDPYRKRQVKLYALPGEFSYVGVTDTTDAWVAPASASIFSVDVVRLLNRIRAGEDPRPVMARLRVRVSVPEPQEQPQTTATARSRVRVHAHV